jgi:hypothetical protein
MISAAKAATHGSWQCFVWQDALPAGRGSLCVELIYKISGIIPRVVLCGRLLDGTQTHSGFNAAGPNTVDSPSGQTYERVPPSSSAVLADFLRQRPTIETIDPGQVDIVWMGTATDTSDAITRRCLDLTCRLVVLGPNLPKASSIKRLLVARAVEWAAGK